MLKVRYDVFLSHSHDDAKLVEVLGDRIEDEAELRVWLDKWILIPGDHWQRAMSKGLYKAKTCVVCIGKKTPMGWFKEEIERALNRQTKDPSFRVIPVILPGADSAVVDDFLELRTWVNFKDGLNDLEAFHSLICGIRGIPPGRLPQNANSDTDLNNIQTKFVDKLSRGLGGPRSKDFAKTDDRMTAKRTVRKMLHAVPPEPNFVGRACEMAILSKAWTSMSAHLVSVVAWGGFGKSLIVRKWIDEFGIASAQTTEPELIFWWSFYHNDSLEAFVDVALSSFPTVGPYTYKGDHLDARFDALLSCMANTPSIIVLDGLEEMQHTELGDYFGKCRYYHLSNFIRRICEGDCGHSLCVITSRLPVVDAKVFEGIKHININLEEHPLTTGEARSLLVKYGMHGDSGTLDDVLLDYGRHPLAMATIASLVAKYFHGDARKVQSMPSLMIPEEPAKDRFKISRILSWYNSLLSEHERTFLQAVATFRFMAPVRLLWLLLDFSILGIEKDSKQPGAEGHLRAIGSHLSDLRLLRYSSDADSYLLHPLCKKFFASKTPNLLSREFHQIVFEALISEAPTMPDSIDQMWPLIEAVYHGCRCNQAERALIVFRERIERKAGYLTKNLRAWGTKIELCAMFFSGRRFSGDCFLTDPEAQGHLLNASGFAHLNLGLPTKALPLLDRAAQVYANACLTGDEGQAHRNRADALLRLGEIEEALAAARRAVDIDATSKSQQSSLSYVGYCNALLGSFDDAEAAFEKGTTLFGQDWMPPIRGVQYIEALILMKRFDEAVVKARRMLEWTATQGILFSEAECYRVLGLAIAEISIACSSAELAGESIEHLARAVNKAVAAEVHYYSIRTILESTTIYVKLGISGIRSIQGAESARCNRQLKEVLQISQKSSYRLLEAQAHYSLACLAFLCHDKNMYIIELERANSLSQALKHWQLRHACNELQGYIDGSKE